MARLQILELPTEHHGDDMVTPFVLVIDKVQNPESMLDFLRDPPHLRDELGARTILVFDEEVEIPANEVPVDPDGYPLKVRVEGDFELFREQVQDEIRKTLADLKQTVVRG